jgi:hypothetical protein
MEKGVEIRAQIDSENVKGLLLINGGGAVALLAFLPTIFGKPNFQPLTILVLWALFAFQIGLVAAVIHNRLRRICSLVYESYWRRNSQPPRCKLIPAWLKRSDPCACFVSIIFMWLSLVAFVTGGILVFCGGLKVIEHTDAKQESSCWQLQEIQKRVYKVNVCTGTFERIELDTTTSNKPLNQPRKNGASVSLR